MNVWVGMVRCVVVVWWGLDNVLMEVGAKWME